METGGAYGNQIDAGLLGCRHKLCDGEDAILYKMAGVTLMQSPVRVEGDGGVTHCTDLLEDIEPQAWDGQAKRVELSGVDQDPFAMYEDRVLIPCNLPERQKECTQSF